jgi:hypothetical protein
MIFRIPGVDPVVSLTLVDQKVNRDTQNVLYTLTKRNAVEAQKAAPANVTAHLITKAVEKNDSLDLEKFENEGVRMRAEKTASEPAPP